MNDVTAKGYLNKIKKLSFLTNVAIYIDCIRPLYELSKLFQKNGLNYGKSIILIENKIELLKSLLNDSLDYFIELKLLIKNIDPASLFYLPNPKNLNEKVQLYSKSLFNDVIKKAIKYGNQISHEILKSFEIRFDHSDALKNFVGIDIDSIKSAKDLSIYKNEEILKIAEYLNIILCNMKRTPISNDELIKE